MWEAIRANRRRSVLIITAMALLLLALGAVIGGAINPQTWWLGLIGAAIAWAVLLAVAFGAGRNILLAGANAREIDHADAPQLANVVEEMSIAAGLGKPPKVYIVDNDAPNAFAVGTPENAAVACTTGLLMRLNRDELQGVVAHEIGHIVNRDTTFFTHAGVMLAAIVILSDGFLRGMLYSGRGSRRRSSRRGGGKAQAVLLIAALLMAVLAPLVAQALYFACSRRREYLADACSARFTRYPEGLASALEKISRSTAKMEQVNRATAPMYTVNPRKKSEAFSLFATHPPVQKRIAVLRGMGKSADYGAYNEAFRENLGESAIGRRTLAEAELVGIRSPSPEPEKPDLEKAREAVDILHRMNGMLFLACACGLKTKVPASYEGDTVHCPRCGRANALPKAVMAATAAAALAGEGIEGADRPEPAPPKKPAVFKYTPGQWQSFRCPCGRTIQLSPAFKAPRVRCPDCRRRIEIKRV